MKYENVFYGWMEMWIKVEIETERFWLGLEFEFFCVDFVTCLFICLFSVYHVYIDK